MRLRQQRIELLEVLVFFEGDRRPRRGLILAGEVLRRLHRHHHDRSRFALGSLRIREPDGVFLEAAIRVRHILDDELVEARHYRAFDAHHFAVERRRLFYHVAHGRIHHLSLYAAAKAQQ